LCCKGSIFSSPQEILNSLFEIFVLFYFALIRKSDKFAKKKCDNTQYSLTNQKN